MCLIYVSFLSCNCRRSCPRDWLCPSCAVVLVRFSFRGKVPPDHLSFCHLDLEPAETEGWRRLLFDGIGGSVSDVGEDHHWCSRKTGEIGGSTRRFVLRRSELVGFGGEYIQTPTPKLRVWMWDLGVWMWEFGCGEGVLGSLGVGVWGFVCRPVVMVM